MKATTKVQDTITLRGARLHNLKNVTVEIPKNRLVVITGISGSGKSTLVFDTLHKEAQRQLMESLGFVTDGLSKPPLDGVSGLSPSISVDQHLTNHSPRSTVGTATEVFTYLRVLFARLGHCPCPACGADIPPAYDEPEELPVESFGEQVPCPACGTPVPEMGMAHFSFNVPGGRCERCQGSGVLTVNMHFLPDVEVRCPACRGRRFSREVLEVKYRGHSIADVLELTIEAALPVFAGVAPVASRLRLLIDVGLGYLKLGQPATTFSGGEAQRIKLTKELARGNGHHTLYLLDEPTTGLHPTDTTRLLDVLQRLVDAGNSVVVIEHNLDVVRAADWIVDLGPEGGAAGGRLIAEGPPERVAQVPESITGRYLR